MSNFWSIYSSLGFVKIKNKWLSGRKMYHMSFEICSIDNKINMYIRCLETHKDTIESSIYSQFPEAEIQEVRDYIEEMPFETPNKNWNMYGFDEKLMKNDVYPIKTYSNFFEEKADQNREEKRIDPISVLFEGLNKLSSDEQIWMQIRVEPTTSSESDYESRGKQLIDKLSYRNNKSKDKNESFVPVEMKLTPREREIVKAIEDKIGKLMFKVNIRCLYFGKRDIFQRGRRTLAEQYFSGFNTKDLNAMKKWSKTKTRIYNFFTERRLFVRQRNMLRRYALREVPLYPRTYGTFVLNTEELATMFHFPVTTKAFSSLSVSNSKKGSAPTELPTNN